MATLTFQIVDWNCRDINVNQRNYTRDGLHDIPPKKKYVMEVFGRSEQGESVSVTILDYKPYFFIELPHPLTLKQQHSFLDQINDSFSHFTETCRGTITKIKDFHFQCNYCKKNYTHKATTCVTPKNLETCLNGIAMKECTQVERYKFYGYQWEQKTTFLKIVFYSHSVMKKVAELFSSQKYSLNDRMDSDDKRCDTTHFPIHIDGVVLPNPLQLYEVNVEPFIRYIHEKEINPCGWLQVPRQSIEQIDVYIRNKNTTHDIVCDFNQVQSFVKDNIGPMLIASFDIEADSSHGDFPQPKKDYFKLASDIVFNFYDQRKKECHVSVGTIKSWLLYAFQYQTSCNVKDTIQTVYTVDNQRPDKDTLLESIATNVYTLLLKAEDSSDKKKKNKIIGMVKKYLDKCPPIEGDKVIQIGTVFYKFGTTEPLRKVIYTLDTCDPIDGIEVRAFPTERLLLLEWSRLLRESSPDVIIGYNTFGFDYQFIWKRVEELQLVEEFNQCTKIRDEKTRLMEKKLVSAGLGENTLSFLTLPGTVQIDVLKVVQRDYKLASYKLDDVATNFIHGKIGDRFTHNLEQQSTTLISDNAYGLIEGDYLHIFKMTCVGEEHLENEAKYKILQIQTIDKTVEITVEGLLPMEKGENYLWGQAKDDITPKQIFLCQKGSSADRAMVAKYCIQDCILVINLLLKMDIMPNNIGMANVCFVPLQYIFTRGQGVKTFSLVSCECRKDDYLIPYVYKPFVNTQEEEDEDEENDDSDSDSDSDDEDDKEGYEGAIVLPPKPKIYFEPISVMDYNSLYPSSMISENISHNTIVLEPEFLGEEGAVRLRERGIEFEDVSYDNYVYVKKGKQKVKMPNVEKPVITCRYIQPKRDEMGNIIDSERGIIPKILMKLLKARKDTRKRIETESDPFKRSVLDGLQLAYKVTANSIYGSIGASVNPIYFKDIAASTTAVGRRMLTTAKAFIEKHYEGAEIVYGDTDSIFINFHPKDENGNVLEGEQALQRSIELGEEASNHIRSILRKPHCLEYEKTFYPFILFTKKRYVGNKYTTDIKKFVLASMGIVLKRRDNAPILKYVYGQIINIILNKKNILESIEFLRNLLYRIISNEFPLNYFVITKCLKSQYKTPDKIVHKVLADRIAERDPGNKPQSNDRIPYVYIDLGAKEAKLQGDRVEHPEFIRQHNLKIDYLFYITNQISKPVCQIYSLVLEQLPGYSKTLTYYSKIEKALQDAGVDEKKIKKKLGDMRVAEAHEVLLKPIIDEEVKRHAEEHSIVLKVKKEINRKQLKVLNVVVETYAPPPETEKKPRKRASPKKDVVTEGDVVVLPEKVKINRKTKQVAVVDNLEDLPK